jgi:hypothetical protein
MHCCGAASAIDSLGNASTVVLVVICHIVAKPNRIRGYVLMRHDLRQESLRKNLRDGSNWRSRRNRKFRGTLSRLMQKIRHLLTQIKSRIGV